VEEERGIAARLLCQVADYSGSRGSWIECITFLSKNGGRDTPQVATEYLKSLGVREIGIEDFG
jgi:hypothetical protein